MNENLEPWSVESLDYVSGLKPHDDEYSSPIEIDKPKEQDHAPSPQSD